MPEPTAPDPDNNRGDELPSSDIAHSPYTRRDRSARDEEVGRTPTPQELVDIRRRTQGRPEILENEVLRDPEAMAAQQEINEAGAQAAWLNTPDGKTFASLVAKQEAGIVLSREEKNTLARIRAKRENRHKP